MVNKELIESKYKDLIDMAVEIMSSIKEPLHNHIHVNSVVRNAYDILNTDMFDNADPEVVILSCYWHDVGRSIDNHTHEQISADMLERELRKRGYPEDFIHRCYLAIINHRREMKPTTIEGKILYDADKLDFVSLDRWNECINSGRANILYKIVALIPNLRNDILHFEATRRLYDDKICDVVGLMYELLKDKISTPKTNIMQLPLGTSVSHK